ncbi:MAG: RNA-binding protein [Gemmatimonadetes bacterium]|nr:RNA-binding protein [Gemmatimonadota bacterium]
MKPPTKHQLTDGAHVRVIEGTHAGKAGTVHDIKTGKTGHVSITVRQANGVRFKTLARNVEPVTGTR